MNAILFRKSCWSVVLATVFAVALGAAAVKSAMARGGGHGGGGHGGGHAGHFGGERHPYHPTARHFDSHGAEHRDDHRHDENRYRYHHHDWHHAGWYGPGFWGGLGLGYLGGWGTGYYGGGNTYVDNSSAAASTGDASSNDNSSTDDTAANAGDNTQTAGSGRLPVDVWPELGISTYDGQYGQSRGLVVVRVMPNSPADRAGFVPGDVLLTFNNQPVPDDNALEALVAAAPQGKFDVFVWDARTGRKSTLSGQLDLGTGGQATSLTK